MHCRDLPPERGLIPDLGRSAEGNFQRRTFDDFRGAKRKNAVSDSLSYR
jgi:hypothetical protein